MGTILILGALTAVGAIGWTLVQVRTLGPGPERDSVANSFWFLGGSALLILSLAMGVEPFTLPMSVRWSTLAASVSLTAVGSVRARRLAAARRRRLVAATDVVTTLIDRVEAHEARYSMDQGPPTRIRAVRLGSKLIVAASAAWVASIASSPLLGAVAVAGVVWAGADALGIVRARSMKKAHDEERAALLGRPRDTEAPRG